MRIISKISALATMLVLLISACSRKADTAGDENTYGVSETDSVAILANTDEIMELFQEERFDEAISKIYVFNSSDSTVSPLPAETAQQLRNRSRIFPVKRFNVKEADFRDPAYNSVVYDVIFGEPASENEEAPITKMAFNIINIDGTFYVTIMDQPTL